MFDDFNESVKHMNMYVEILKQHLHARIVKRLRDITRGIAMNAHVQCVLKGYVPSAISPMCWKLMQHVF